MKQLTIQSLGFLIGFQNDIKIIIIIKFIIIIIIIIIIIVILACPDTRCESGQTSGSCRNICHGRGTCSTRDLYGPWSSYQEV